MRQKLKKTLLLAIMFVTMNTYAVESQGRSQKVQETAHTESVTASAFDWTEIMNAIISVESKGNPNARNGSYVGILQIGPGMVRECNEILKRKKSSKRYSLSDRYNPKKSKEMFILVQDYHNKRRSPKDACRIWNSGPYAKSVKNAYWKKFLSYYKK